MSKPKKKLKLRDLSRTHPTSEESRKLHESVLNAEPTTTAIIRAVMVEIELESSIRGELLGTRKPSNSDEEWDALVDENGPLGSFHRKILIGLALGLYSAEIADNLHIVRNIRNAFAHAKKLITFDHELIVAALKRVALPPVNKRLFKLIRSLRFGARESFILLCGELTTEILKIRNAALRKKVARAHREKKEFKRKNRRLARETMKLRQEIEAAKALVIPNIATLLLSPLWPLLLARLNQTVDPNAKGVETALPNMIEPSKNNGKKETIN
jgi:hypothetical protein